MMSHKTKEMTVSTLTTNNITLSWRKLKIKVNIEKKDIKVIP